MKKVVFVLLLVIAGQWLSAQEGAYEVKGSVSDSSGEAIIGATITLQRDTTATTLTGAVSNEQGAYALRLRIFHSKMQFGVELALLRTPPPPLGGREEQVASCRDEKRDDALTVPLRLMQYICCGNKNLAIYKYASNPSAKIRNCCSSEDWHISKKDRRGHRSTP